MVFLSDNNVIEEPDLPEPHGGRDGGTARLGTSANRLRLDDLDVVHAEPLVFELLFRARLDFLNGHTAAQLLARLAQDARKSRRAPPLRGREIDVARRARQAVRLTVDLAHHEPHGEVQVRDHPGNDGRLLEVLASENRDVGADDCEELRDHGGHTGEMSGPDGALLPLGNTSYLHTGREAL